MPRTLMCPRHPLLRTSYTCPLQKKVNFLLHNPFVFYLFNFIFTSFIYIVISKFRFLDFRDGYNWAHAKVRIARGAEVEGAVGVHTPHIRTADAIRGGCPISISIIK